MLDNFSDSEEVIIVGSDVDHVHNVYHWTSHVDGCIDISGGMLSTDCLSSLSIRQKRTCSFASVKKRWCW